MQVGGAAVQYSVRALDSNGVGIAGAALQVSSSLGNGLNPASLSTDPSGAASFIYTPNLGGTDTLSISGMGSSASTQVLVSAVDFSVISPASNTNIMVEGSSVMQVSYRNNNVGMAGQTVSF